MLDRTRQLVNSPDAENPRALLAEVLRSAVELLSLPENDFAWSGWRDKDAAIAEIEAVLALVEAGALPERLPVSVLFAPTGPIQEVSVSSGWGEVFLQLAERYDRAERALWK